MSESESVAYILILIFFLGMIGPVISSPPSGTIVNPFSCRELEGTIVGKEDDEQGRKLYVQIYTEEWDGYIVYVSNSTYNSYEIGYTYEQTTCDLLEYEDILNTLDNMIDSGWLTPSTD